VLALARQWQPRLTLIEDAGSGISLAQVLAPTRLTFKALKPVGDKQFRARITTPLFERGKVYVPDGVPWVPDFVDELISFPSAKHDDMVDAMAMTLNYLDSTYAGLCDPKLAQENIAMHNEMIRQRNRSLTFDSPGSPFWGARRTAGDTCEEQDRIDDAGGPNVSGWGSGPTWRRDSYAKGPLGLPRGRVTW